MNYIESDHDDALNLRIFVVKVKSKSRMFFCKLYSKVTISHFFLYRVSY